MKRFLILSALGLLPAVACDDQASTSVKQTGEEAGTGGSTAKSTPGVCKLAECPKPMTGIPCCTPTADCGMDPTGVGLTCLPNPDSPTSRECRRGDGGKIYSDGVECRPQLIGTACCTALGGCGWDPFGSGFVCFANPPQINPTCDVSKCVTTDGGAKACCLPNGGCGTDALGIGICFPPPLPAPPPTCDVTKCDGDETGLKACCLPNGQCGVDTLGIGVCFPPPPKPTCDLSKCGPDPSGLRSCCLPNGQCGTDTLGIGVCFVPPLPPPNYTQVPDDPRISSECPSFIGAFGYPVWGCCERVGKYGVCGQFQGNQCLLFGQIPTGPPPAADSGITEPFLRCTPPPPSNRDN